MDSNKKKKSVVFLTCFQVILVDVRRAVASAHCLLDFIGVLHHVLQLILNVLSIRDSKQFNMFLWVTCSVKTTKVFIVLRAEQIQVQHTVPCLQLKYLTIYVSQ